MATITKKKTKTSQDSVTSKPFRIDLHNDNWNTFQHVINCLVQICGHEYHQAEQCAQIVHYNGKCDVKYGDYETISVMKEKLQSAGLSVTMEIN
jgi:ATP-dependent Clp protease adaptor protein ClpS